MERKLRVAVLGLGNWGECHVQAFANLPHAEIVAVGDLNEQRLNEIGEKYQIPGKYTDYQSLINNEQIDLLSIVTREDQHLESALFALSRGIHVLIEKPVTLKANEAREILETAQKYQREVIPGHVLRFDPRYAEIFRATQTDEVGEVISMYFRRSRPREAFPFYSRTHTVYMSMVHDIDLAIWYAGCKVSKVRAHERYVTDQPVPDLVWASLEFENGVIAYLQSNWLTPESAGVEQNDAIEVVGRHGIVQFEHRTSGMEIWNDQGRKMPNVWTHYSYNQQFVGVLQMQMASIVSSLLTKEAIEQVNFFDAIHGIEVAESVITSARTNQEIILE